MRFSLPTAVRASLASLLVILCATLCSAQFTSSVQGIVQDGSGAGLSSATVQIINKDTQISQTTTSDGAGNFRFVSLPPGAYKVVVEAKGFAKSEADVTLLTEENLNVPITLKMNELWPYIAQVTVVLSP